MLLCNEIARQIALEYDLEYDVQHNNKTVMLNACNVGTDRVHSRSPIGGFVPGLYRTWANREKASSDARMRRLVLKFANVYDIKILFHASGII